MTWIHCPQICRYVTLTDVIDQSQHIYLHQSNINISTNHESIETQEFNEPQIQLGKGCRNKINMYILPPLSSPCKLDNSTFGVLRHQFNIISADEDAFKDVCLYQAHVLQKIV